MAKSETLREVLAGIPGLADAVASATREAAFLGGLKQLPKPVRAAILKSARKQGRADEAWVKELTSDITEPHEHTSDVDK